MSLCPTTMQECDKNPLLCNTTCYLTQNPSPFVVIGDTNAINIPVPVVLNDNTADGLKKVMDSFTDEQCLKASEIIGGANHLSPESQIAQFRELMKEGFYRQTNISGRSWFKLYQFAASHLQGKGQENYTQHFIEWRDKFFNHEIKALEYRSKSNSDRWLSVDDLHKMYEKAMLNSPFNPHPH